MALDIGCCALWHKAPILSGPKPGSWVLHGFSTKQLLFCGHGQAGHTGLRVVWQMGLLALKRKANERQIYGNEK